MSLLQQFLKHPLRTAGRWRKMRRDYRLLRRQTPPGGIPFGPMYPILTDAAEEGGTMRGHYFHQDLLVARRIYEHKPARHIDIGSRTDGFVAHLAVFRQVELLDIRPIESKVPGIGFRQADLMNLPPDLEGACESISSLHAIEHFGLGRYGDPVDAQGHVKAIENIHRMLAPGGRFYFAVPIGPLRVEFNAHRVFSIGYLLRLLGDKFTVERFSYVDDAGDLHEDAALSPARIADSFGCRYGCGIFELRKKYVSFG